MPLLNQDATPKPRCSQFKTQKQSVHCDDSGSKLLKM